MLPTIGAPAPMKGAKRSGEKALDIYQAVNPTVVSCLSDLTSELQQLLEWAEGEGVGHETNRDAEEWVAASKEASEARAKQIVKFARNQPPFATGM